MRLEGGKGNRVVVVEGAGLIAARVGGELVGGNTHSFSQSLFNLHNPVLMGSGGGGRHGGCWRGGKTAGQEGEKGKNNNKLVV